MSLPKLQARTISRCCNHRLQIIHHCLIERHAKSVLKDSRPGVSTTCAALSKIDMPRLIAAVLNGKNASTHGFQFRRISGDRLHPPPARLRHLFNKRLHLVAGFR